MLTIYRRHQKNCQHRTEGRKYRRCRCPIWVDGFLNGEEMRESLDLRDWEKAQQRICEWETAGVKQAPAEAMTIAAACNLFLDDARARGLRESSQKKYRALFRQLEGFAAAEGLRLITQLDTAAVRKFRAAWRDKNTSSMKKLERLRAFFNFAVETGWTADNPAKHIKNPVVSDPPTMPFTQNEMTRMLAACDQYPDNYGNIGQANAVRLRALVFLLRYSGMRIGDAVTCAKERLNGERLFLRTEKTGVPVNLKLPAFVAEALRDTPAVSAGYFFWSGEGKKETVAGNWRRSLRKLFKLAGIKGGHPHRFRDTFAVELLLAGIPLERVSILLGHRSVRITERHYAPWVRARQEQLEADLERTWALDPIVLAQRKGTPEVHGNAAAVN